MKLYKYIGLTSAFGPTNCEAILRESKLWVSDYRKLNDPFEFRFVLNKPDDSKLDFAIAVKNSKKGVISFSTVNNDLLLWAHYGGCHRGLCFEFESEFDKTLSTVRPISYLPTMPVFDSAKPDEMLYAKSKDWKYEAEARVIIPELHDTYCGLNPISLTGVYFGFKVTSDDIEKFDPLCESKTIPRYQVETVRNDYRVVFRTIQNRTEYSVVKSKTALKKLIQELRRKDIVQRILDKKKSSNDP